jgi:hypothetical protein
MTATATTSNFRILGICDEVNACECCGKSDLQKTVAILNTETGTIGYFGSSCAMQPAKCFGFEKSEMNRALRDFKSAQQILWGKARRIYKERGGKMVPREYAKTSFGFPIFEYLYADQPLFDSICAELGPITTIRP